MLCTLGIALQDQALQTPRAAPWLPPLRDMPQGILRHISVVGESWGLPLVDACLWDLCGLISVREESRPSWGTQDQAPQALGEQVVHLTRSMIRTMGILCFIQWCGPAVLGHLIVGGLLHFVTSIFSYSSINFSATYTIDIAENQSE